MGLLDGVVTLQGIVLLLLAFAAFGLEVYALVDAIRQKGPAFPAAGKLTKPIWLGILGVATAIGFISLGPQFMNLLFLNIIGVVAAGVYLADVRPAVRGMSGRGGSGPYGYW